MNPKLPVVSGRQVVRALERVGYRVVRQRGSHIGPILPPGGMSRCAANIPGRDRREPQLNDEEWFGVMEK